LDFIPLIKKLCEPAGGVVAPGNEVLFAYLQQELPFKIHRYPSGSETNGWVIHDHWEVEKALIKKKGKVIFDGLVNTLAVARYSNSFQGTLSWEALKLHVVSSEKRPTAYVFHCAWQYRPWDADWAFSIPHELVKTWEPGDYEVDLVTHKKLGDMLLAEYHHQGTSDKTIVFNSNTCHPHMANDGFCGSALLIRLLQEIKEKKTFYSYKLILAPEHLGSVFYLENKSPQELEQMVGGAFLEMLGTEGPFKITSTFLGGHPIDHIFSHVLTHYSCSFDAVPWRQGAGNDETVWEAPGYEVPFVEFTRSQCLFDPFHEYHTHLDNAELMDEDQLQESYRVLQECVFVLENNARLYRHFDGLICLSNPKYDLYQERPDPSMMKDLPEDAEKWGLLQDSLQRYFDGSVTILDIAIKHDVPFKRLFSYLKQFEGKGLIDMRFEEIERVPISPSLKKNSGSL